MERLIGHIYDSLEDDDALAALPDAISGEIGSRSCVIQLYSESSALEEMWLNYFTREMDDFYRENNLHPFDEFAIDMSLIGYHVAKHHGDFRTVESFCSSFFYNEFLRRFGDDSAHCIGFASPDANGSQVNVGLHRGRKQTDFTSEQVRKLDVIRPHLTRMLNIRRNLRRSEGRGVGALMGIDSVEDAFLVISFDRKIVFANAAAEFLLEEGTLLSARSGLLEIGVPHEDAALSACLQDVVERRADGRTAFIAHDRSGQTWRFTVAPRTVDGQTMVLVWIDRGKVGATAPERLRQLYGLTSAEVAIMMSLSEGKAAREIADMHGVTVATVRTHIQHIFSKTGVNKASQLAALAGTLPKV